MSNVAATPDISPRTRRPWEMWLLAIANVLFFGLLAAHGIWTLLNLHFSGNEPRGDGWVPPSPFVIGACVGICVSAIGALIGSRIARNVFIVLLAVVLAVLLHEDVLVMEAAIAGDWPIDWSVEGWKIWRWPSVRMLAWLGLNAWAFLGPRARRFYAARHASNRP
jgi:hypothetical protein